MYEKLSIRQRFICGIIMLCVAVSYATACIEVWTAGLRRTAGELPNSAGLQTLGFALTFPFCFVPGIEGEIGLMLNGGFWSVVSGAFYVFLCRRKARRLISQ
jgi:hypothetical protein